MTNISKLDKIEGWVVRMDAFLEGLETPPPTTGMPAHRFGCHLINSREADLLYIERLRPASVKIVDPDPEVVRRVLRAIDPNGVVILRDHPLSEQKNDVYKDPVGTGNRHAADWIAKLTTGRFAEFGRDKRIVVIGVNEPNVHNAAEANIVCSYSVAFLSRLTAAGIRGGVLNLSVGWPREENGRVIWDELLPLEPLILRNNGFLITHEYWYPTVQSGWGDYGNRIKHCPFAVPIIIGECAYTKQLVDPPLPQPWGWRSAMTAPAYAESLWWYHDNVDVNVHSIMPFTTGFGGAEWESKDTQPAHADILARKHGYTFPSVWPVKKTIEEIPPVETDKDLIVFPKYTNKITGSYGTIYNSSYAHEGMDISTGTGMPIYAAYDGICAYADYEEATYGWYVRLYAPEINTCFFYAHMMQEPSVKTGNSIKRGQLLGYTGATGNTGIIPAAHLHFETRVMNPNGTYKVFEAGALPLHRRNGRVDPLGWIEGWKAAGNRVEER